MAKVAVLHERDRAHRCVPPLQRNDVERITHVDGCRAEVDWQFRQDMVTLEAVGVVGDFRRLRRLVVVEIEREAIGLGECPTESPTLLLGLSRRPSC